MFINVQQRVTIFACYRTRFEMLKVMLQFTYWILPLQHSTITALWAVHFRIELAPEGSKVYEFDLSALQLDPHNQKALNNLQAFFEPACHNVEEAIAKGELDEAERELRLLRGYGAQQAVQQDSYKVSLLGSYLYAQRTVLIRKHETEAFEMQGGKSSNGAN